MKGRKVKHVAVLGAGPAGLFAALAAARLGYKVDIYSHKKKSELFGAQYLHGEIPEFGLGDPAWIDCVFRGTPESYAQKVYGDPTVEISEATHYGWDIRQAYDLAWGSFEGDIVETGADITGADVTDLLGRRTYKRVISSIPLEPLCSNPSHTFVRQEIWASGDAPELDRWAPFQVDPWTVVCDGTEDVSWYRAANVFGHSTVEWATEMKPPVDNVSRVVRPVGNNCDCFPGLLRVGRHGEWRKGVLVHDAYNKVVNQL